MKIKKARLRIRLLSFKWPFLSNSLHVNGKKQIFNIMKLFCYLWTESNFHQKFAKYVIYCAKTKIIKYLSFQSFSSQSFRNYLNLWVFNYKNHKNLLFKLHSFDKIDASKKPQIKYAFLFLQDIFQFSYEEWIPLKWKLS